MRLVHSVGILVAELQHDLLDFGVVLGLQRFADEGLELKGTAFTLVVELVVQRFRDVGVHAGVAVRRWGCCYMAGYKTTEKAVLVCSRQACCECC